MKEKESKKYYFWKYFSEILGDLYWDYNPFKFLFFGWHAKYTKFKDDIYSESQEYSEFVNMIISNKIKPGDIFFTTHQHYVSTMTIPGEMSHAALYVGKTKKGKYRIMHAVRYGVIEESVWSLARTDEIVVIRPKNITNIEKEKAIKKALSFKGKDYDYFFQFTNDHRMCCTELVFNAYKEYREKFGMKLTKRFALNKFKIVDTIVADDFMCFDIELIFTNSEARKLSIIKDFIKNE